MFLKKQHFMQSIGAKCNNWRNSWSYVQRDKKMVIFGAWDFNTDDDKSLILHTDWKTKNNRNQPGYSQAIKHLEFIGQGYELFTFSMENISKSEGNPKVGRIGQSLEKRILKIYNGGWYAYKGDYQYLPDEVEYYEKEYFEGERKLIQVNAYERSREAREKCIQIHGTICAACNFDFESTYGEHGKGFIHVHHITRLSLNNKRCEVNPENDLIPLCPNCHAMIHRFKEKELSLDDLKSLILSCKI